MVPLKSTRADALIYLARNLHSAQPAHVLGDSTVERFGDALAVFGGPQSTLVAGIADERNLRQDRRHVGPNENDKGRLLDSAVANSRTLRGQSAVQRTLDIGGELTRFVDLFLQRDLLDQILEFVDRFF